VKNSWKLKGIIVAGLLIGAILTSIGTKVEGQDLIPPYAVWWNPPTGGANIPINANIEVQWSEAMDTSSVEMSFAYRIGSRLYGSADGVWTHTINFQSTFDPFIDFPYGEKVSVLFDTRAKDLAGNPLDQDKDGIGGESGEDELLWDFTTEAQPDTTSPFIVSTMPVNGASNVPINTNIRIVFSESMDTLSVENAFSYTDGSRTWTKADGTITWQATATKNDTMTFNPTNNLAYRTTYTAMVMGSIARDLAVNPLDGNHDGRGGDDYAW